MKKYEINTWGELYKNSTNAAFKAPNDVDIIYSQNGFKVIRLPNVTFLYKLRLGLIWRILYALFILFRLKKDSEVHIQVTGSRITRYIIRFIRFRAKKIVLLIHDVNFLRNNDTNKTGEEIDLYNSADEIIVHTPSMANKLKQQGVHVPMKILMIFDYLTQKDKQMYAEPDIHSIVFAGNIHKSPFIQLLIEESKEWHLNFYCYGAGKFSDIDEYTHIHYEGIFSPDNIFLIKGAWGLVWDGNDLFTCNSYLRYNAPHKLSLYLAAEKPVIIWRRSAMYDFVNDHKLGIAIDSLHEIQDCIFQITEDQYSEYVRNVRIVSDKLKTGGFLSNQLSAFF